MIPDTLEGEWVFRFPLPWTGQLDAIKAELERGIFESGIGCAIFRKEMNLAGVAAPIHGLDGAGSGDAVAVVDFTEIEQGLPDGSAARHPAVFHHTPVAVLLAVLESLVRTQKLMAPLLSQSSLISRAASDSHLSVPDAIPLPLLLLAFFLASMLYAAVGHGGASAYLAVMGFAGMAPPEMKPIALALNIAVSAMALAMFGRAGHFRGKLFWPLAIASVPAAFLGGWLQSPDPVFKLILAGALLFGAWRLAFGCKTDMKETRAPHLAALLVLGLALGFVSGLIGIGGGIFLTPLLILFRWSPAKPAAAISAAFILANSLSGLGGFLAKGGAVPALTWMLLPAAVAGGWFGATWGSGKAHTPALRLALAAVLVIAATKFLVA